MLKPVYATHITGLLFLIGSGCHEYNPRRIVDLETDLADTEDTAIDDTGDIAPEVCDGEDNDNDGEIDEGYWDVDGDGVADCVDTECDVIPAEAVSEYDDTCAGDVSSPPASPWRWAIEWQWTGGAVQSTPVVGDLDLDGTPEVLFTSSQNSGTLIALDGSTGTEVFSVPGIDAYSGVALGDVDLDGYGDVIATSGNCYKPHEVMAIDKTGSILWSTTGPSACETYPLITDLEGDGDVEIIVNEVVFDGATGAVVATLAIDGTNNWGAPVVADMDGDGIQEILLENRMYDASGSLRMTCGEGGIGTFPHPVNVDSDLQGEWLVAAPGLMTLCDDDGSVLWTRSYYSYGAPIAVADFDNDGEQEFAFAKGNKLYLIEKDNSVRWTAAIIDYSGSAGPTSWDIDLDGIPEVVYADERDILVLDGATGAVKIRESSHGSITLTETPAVADVDGDGQGELIYGSSTGLQGVTVIGSADGDWPYSRPVYNQFTYYGANIEDDLSVPASPDAPWIDAPNLFRGQPSAVFRAGSPNLKAQVADVCVASCTAEGSVHISGVVWNSGSATVSSGTSYQLIGWQGDTLTEIATLTTSTELAPGASETFVLETTRAHIGEEVQVVVDTNDQLAECYEDDNTSVFNGWYCP